MVIDSYVFTNTGGRSYNEDYVEIKKHKNNALFALADGLGGHQHGELASKCVVETLINSFPEKFETDVEDWLEKNLLEANEKIISIQEEKSAVIKTTAVALIIDDKNAKWTHIGDSRLYYLHNNSISSITEDHSVAYKKYKAGEITRDEIATDEDQSRLIRSLGSERCTPVFDNAEVCKGDGFLLCSDGMWEYIFDEEILVDFLKADSAENWGELMLMRVMERIPDDSDNLSLITVFIT